MQAEFIAIYFLRANRVLNYEDVSSIDYLLCLIIVIFLVLFNDF